MAAAWIRFLDWDDSHSPPSEVEWRLRRAGIIVSNATTNDGPGLVAFGSESESVCEFIAEASQHGQTRVVALAGSAHVLSAGFAWRLLAAGSSDVLAWDSTQEPAARIAAEFNRWQQVDEITASPAVRDTLVGESRAWLTVIKQLVEVASFTDATVLLTGETGTGKELAARLIHTLDRRPDKGDFVVADCTTIVPTLAGSEFFGHEKGAFTGAVSARDGAFATAHGGTLFLDEISELPPPLQAELLRVIQDGMYKRVGSDVWRRARFRLVCATNRDLLDEELAGRFRRDLYFRIAGWVIRLPSLRERREDIPLLARHFLSSSRKDAGSYRLDDAVQELLLGREYPGNVRDLRQLVSRMGWRHEGPGPITPGDVAIDDRPVPPAAPTEKLGTAATTFTTAETALETAVHAALTTGLTLKEISQRTVDLAVRLAIETENGNLHRAARRLGVTDRALQLRRAAARGQNAGRRPSPHGD